VQDFAKASPYPTALDNPQATGNIKETE
jgi:hypothetical protein